VDIDPRLSRYEPRKLSPSKPRLSLQTSSYSEDSEIGRGSKPSSINLNIAKIDSNESFDPPDVEHVHRADFPRMVGGIPPT